MDMYINQLQLLEFQNKYLLSSIVRNNRGIIKKAPTKFMYGEPNEVGNFCIAGHNYRNKKFFSKVPTLENGDIIEITDTKGRTVKYTVYNKYTVTDDDMSPVSQLTMVEKILH